MTTFGADLLATLSTPRPKLHVITTTKVDGYLCTVCACGAGLESLGFDESSTSASNYWSLVHTNAVTK